MRRESFGKVSFDSQHVGGLIDIFLATHVAVDSERYLDGRARGDRVGLRKGDFMSVDEVPWNVVEAVFAQHDPAIRTVFPHGLLSEDYKGFAGANLY